MARPLTISIQPCGPNIRFSPDSGLIRDPLGARFAPIQRPSALASCTAITASITPAARTSSGGSTPTAIVSRIRPGAKSSSMARSQVSPVRAALAIASSINGPASASHAAPISTATAVATSRERRMSPFCAASRLRFSVGAKDFSPLMGRSPLPLA